MKSVIVHGPQGCGKTLHAPQLLKHFGLRAVVDEFDAVRTLDIKFEGVLYLTHRAPTYALGLRVVSFADAMQQIKGGH